MKQNVAKLLITHDYTNTTHTHTYTHTHARARIYNRQCNYTIVQTSRMRFPDGLLCHHEQVLGLISIHCVGFRRDVYRRLAAKVGHARREDLLKRISNSTCGINCHVCLKRKLYDVEFATHLFKSGWAFREISKYYRTVSRVDYWLKYWRGIFPRW